jgi:CelD/BcsL family acetyltransferase involved in cellulose biosynthesis
MQLKIHKTFPEGLASDWNALLNETEAKFPFMYYEYLQLWWQTRGGGEWPHAELALVTAHEDGKLIAAAPFFFTPDFLGRPALLLLGSIEISDYLDLLVRPSDLPAFVDALLPFLSEAGLPDWKVIELYDVLENSPTLPAFEEAAKKRGWKYSLEPYKHCPNIHLPGDWNSYLGGIDKKQRHEIRRKMRRLEEAGVDARWYLVQDPTTLDVEIENFLELMHQDIDKAQFLTKPMQEHMRLTAHWAFDAGILHLAFLEINGEKAAGKMSFDYRNILWGYNSGVDRRFMEYSPGWVLLGYVLRWANEEKRSILDFMRGDEEYKYRFGAVDRLVMHATMEK